MDSFLEYLAEQYFEYYYHFYHQHPPKGSEECFSYIQYEERYSELRDIIEKLPLKEYNIVKKRIEDFKKSHKVS